MAEKEKLGRSRAKLENLKNYTVTHVKEDCKEFPEHRGRFEVDHETKQIIVHCYVDGFPTFKEFLEYFSL